ncbi:MAG: hypothetical protein HYV68_03025 [Candidatus Taylorbacteria bacterium]|nr:hypothetical protein [Candidatus Taylorbacteria bacterium]
MKFCLPVSTLQARRLRTTFRLAKAAGFDIVELLLAGWILKNPIEAAKMAVEEGFKEIRFHQAWTEVTSSEQQRLMRILWQLLTKAGWLPKPGSTFWEMVPALTPGDTVVYADEMLEHELMSNHCVQTMSTLSDGEFKMARSEFDQRMVISKQRVVFDTYHDLHYRPNGERILRESSRRVLLGLLFADLEALKDKICEIHVQDWSLRNGRSVWPGTGDLPLPEFMPEIAQSGRDGLIITPETKLFRPTADKLKRLLGDTQDLLS